MQSLFILKKTLERLNDNEKASLQGYLKNYSNRQQQNPKSILLLRLLLGKRELSSTQLQNIIYGKLNYTAFNKLVLRLKEKTYEVMVWDSNITKLENPGNRNMIVFELKKKLLQVEILIYRGILFEIESILNQIIQTSKKYEAYGIAQESLQMKQRYLGFRKGSKGYLKLEHEIEFYELCYSKYIKARRIFTKAAAEINEAGFVKTNRSELAGIIHTLKEDFEITNSSFIGYYYFNLYIDFLIFENQILKAEEHLNLLRNLIEISPALFTRLKIVNVNLNVSVVKLLKFDLSEADSIAKNVIAFMGKSEKINQFIPIEIQFFVKYFKGEYNEADRMIEEWYYKLLKFNVPTVTQRCIYLMACLKSTNEKYIESLELIKEYNDIRTDKDERDIDSQILRIINLIELERWEGADKDIISIKRQFKIRSLQVNNNQRYPAILEILVALMKNSYNFQKSFKAVTKNISQLESSSPEYRWRIKSPELIVFHEWFLAKCKNTKYNPKLAFEKEKARHIHEFEEVS